MQLFDHTPPAPDDPMATAGAIFLRSPVRRGTPPPGDGLDDLRARVASDFRSARGWAELQGRLLLKGFVLRREGERLALCPRGGGAPLCRASDIGVPYAELKQRFGLPLPSGIIPEVRDTPPN